MYEKVGCTDVMIQVLAMRLAIRCSQLQRPYNYEEDLGSLTSSDVSLTNLFLLNLKITGSSLLPTSKNSRL